MGTTASFTPVSPAGRPTCEALELYEASRPTEPVESIQKGSLAVFILFCVAFVGSLFGFVWERDSPRFRTVRPFVSNVQFMLAEFAFMVGTALNQATPNVPCVVMLFSLLLGVSGFGLALLSRAIIYSVESQFAKKAARKEFRLNESDTDSERQSEFTIAADQETLRERFYSNILVTKLALGLVDADQVSTVHLARAKRSYGLVAVLAFTPAIVSAIIHLIIMPPLRECSHCSIFFDISANLACVGSVPILIALRILYVAWKEKFDDTQGVYVELLSVMVTVAPLFIATGTAMMIDPNQVSFRRVFLFEWLLIVAVFIYWWFSVAMQLILAYRDRQRLNIALNVQIASDHPSASDSRPVSSAGIPMVNRNTIDFLTKFESDPQLKAEFEAFIVNQYAVENLHFVVDVRAFKRYFVEKGDSWRKQKARWIFETYVKPNSVMEVNISHSTKQDIIGKIESILKESHADTRKLEFAFDVAIEDIVTNVLKPMWMTFQMRRGNKLKRTWTKSGVSSVSGFSTKGRATVTDAVVPSPHEEDD